MSETESKPAPPPESAPAPGKSEGQLLLDQLLEQFKRLIHVRQDLEEVRLSIAPLPTAGSATTKVPVEAFKTQEGATFFTSLRLLVDGNKQVADELERAVGNIRALF